MKYFLLAMIFFSGSVSANGDHSSRAAQEMNTQWQASADLVYRQETAPIILGFFPVNNHDSTAGLKLEYFDLSYELNDYFASFNTSADKENSAADRRTFQLNAKIDMAWHSNNAEIKQAWLQNQWSQTSEKNTALKIGQYIPRIGFLNDQHHQGFLSTPLVNRTYWGEQMSEAGMELEHAINTEYGQIKQFFNVMGGNHLNSNDETLAYLYQIEFKMPLSNTINTTLLSNYYYADVKDRGLLLFDLTSTNHSHSNSTFNEFFDGTVEHVSVGLALDLQSQSGIWQYQIEYSQRQEQGRVYSDSVNLAQLDLDSQGSYQQIHWQSNQKVWQAGIRHNYLYSDAEVSDTSDNSLDSSRLNNAGQTPQTFDVMLGYAFSTQQTVQLLFSDNIDWQEYPSRFELHYQIKLH
jgi:hypothetical protein